MLPSFLLEMNIGLIKKFNLHVLRPNVHGPFEKLIFLGISAFNYVAR